MTYFCLHTPSILNDTRKHLISEKAREQLSTITPLSPDLLPFKGAVSKTPAAFPPASQPRSAPFSSVSSVIFPVAIAPVSSKKYALLSTT